MRKNRFQIWVTILSLVLFAGGCATVPGGRITDSRKMIYLKDLCERYSLPWQWDHISQTVDLKIEGVSVRILAGSNILLLGKEQVRLNTPVMIEDSSVMLPRDFKVKVMDRFPKLFRSEEHTSELQSQFHLVCRLLLLKKMHLYFKIVGYILCVVAASPKTIKNNK